MNYIELIRLDTKENLNKKGEAYYYLQGIYEYENKKTLVDFYFKDNELYESLLEIPPMSKFKLQFTVGIDFEQNLKLIPTGVEL